MCGTFFFFYFVKVLTMTFGQYFLLVWFGLTAWVALLSASGSPLLRGPTGTTPELCPWWGWLQAVDCRHLSLAAGVSVFLLEKSWKRKYIIIMSFFYFCCC